MLVAVIGAGAAGLCATRHLLSTNGKITPTVFEQSSEVGGTWVYTKNTGKDEYGSPIHSSMYTNLNTNLPKEVMAFPDFPFDESPESFIHHSEVKKYLENYAEKFNLLPHIQLNSQVSCVDPIRGESTPKWEVTTKNLKTEEIKTTIFDSVIICIGHNSVPHIPSISGLDDFTGQVLHSHDYRDPAMFGGKTVVILGASASGVDIGVEIAKVADKVLLSHNNTPYSYITSNPNVKLPKNVIQVQGVQSCVGPNSLSLADGDCVRCDALILCTGYEYSFPFLSPLCGVKVHDRQVTPLYKHLIHTTHPSLAFIGIPNLVVPFRLFHLQSQLFVKTLLGEVTLPAKQEMDRDAEDEMEWRKEQFGMEEKYRHKMGALQWHYYEQLAQIGGIKAMSGAVKSLYTAVVSRRKINLLEYKKDSYTLLGDNSYTGQIFISDEEGYKSISYTRKKN